MDHPYPVHSTAKCPRAILKAVGASYLFINFNNDSFFLTSQSNSDSLPRQLKSHWARLEECNKVKLLIAMRSLPLSRLIRQHSLVCKRHCSCSSSLTCQCSALSCAHTVLKPMLVLSCDVATALELSLSLAVACLSRVLKPLLVIPRAPVPSCSVSHCKRNVKQELRTLYRVREKEWERAYWEASFLCVFSLRLFGLVFAFAFAFAFAISPHQCNFWLNGAMISLLLESDRSWSVLIARPLESAFAATATDKSIERELNFTYIFSYLHNHNP